MATFDLVFEGGGAKGSVFVGALEVFFSAGHKAGRLVGTSAGAITAALLAAGYTPAEMLAAVTEQRNGKPRFAEFMDVPIADEFGDDSSRDLPAHEHTEHNRCSIVPGWLEEKFDQQFLTAMLQAAPTFGSSSASWSAAACFPGGSIRRVAQRKAQSQGCGRRLHSRAIPGAEELRSFAACVTDTTNREMMVLNHRTSPDVPVAMAVRMSMSIPFVWREVVWKKEWGTYLRQG